MNKDTRIRDRKAEKAIYYQKNKAVINKTRKAWKRKNPNKVKNWKLLGRYGITLEQYNQMFEQQEGKCWICQRHQSEFKKALFVDHNHKTNKIRGLLCDDCNNAIGRFKDNPNICEKAASYLRSF